MGAKFFGRTVIGGAGKVFGSSSNDVDSRILLWNKEVRRLHGHLLASQKISNDGAPKG
jgi:hypothetical protein